MVKNLIEYRQLVSDHIEEHKADYINLSHYISHNPEIGNQEFKAAEKFTSILKQANFNVEQDIAGHPTAFIAEKQASKSGPTLVFLAEYDALPGLGHACGHNIIGTASIAAAIGLGEIIDQIGGRIRVYGTPAEEGGPNGSAKGSFVKTGYFKDVDVALMIHPAGKTNVTRQTLAVEPLDFEFFGKTAHASAAPEKGINALDAVIQLYNGINALRQQLASDIRIHGVITHGGQAPNIIPEYASARFFIRATTWEVAEETAEKVRGIAEGASLATGARLKITRFQNEIHDFLINDPLDEIIKQELIGLGEAIDDEKQVTFGSTDAGNVSQVVPTAHPLIKIGSNHLVGHTHEFREAARSEQGDTALIKASKVLALSALRLIVDGYALQQVTRAFEEIKAGSATVKN